MHPTPLVTEVLINDIQSFFAQFANEKGAIWLDSASFIKQLGRYSFIGISPFSIITAKNGKIWINNEYQQGTPLDELKNYLAQFPLNTILNLPPFQGGVAGFWGYDLGRSLEKLPEIAEDDLQFEDMALGVYDLVIAIDHELCKTYLFSSGYPEQDTVKRDTRAKKRLAWLLDKISASRQYAPGYKKWCEPNDIQANFDESNYIQTVDRTIEYIFAGDIFEANISQRFKVEINDLNTYDLYCKLRVVNPAPFAGYFNFGETVIASSSPERFIQLSGKLVETRPIKGTRKRGNNKSEDEQLAKELQNSEKDWAENVMIVDLMRNDLSKVCEDFSVKVPQLCGLESYATVHHLVSCVNGVLQADKGAVDLLKAAFPGGSITGCPKIRSMEIIDELEPTRRGPYCGSMGYIGFNGNMDTSILIRTFSIKNNTVTFQAGGAIVADSNGNEEYQETLTKAQGMIRALVE